MTPEAATVEVALRDGSTVRVRPVAAADRDAMRAFLEALSDRSRWLRFFSGAANLEWAARAGVEVERPDSYGVVATRGDGRIVANATYACTAADRAEVAFAVADELQGVGVATVMLAHLAEAAEEDGIGWFEAQVLPENHRMIDVFRRSGFAVATRTVPGAIEVEFPTTMSPTARERFEERDRIASIAAVRAVLEPRSVAVIGASRRAGTVGNAVLRNLLHAGFTGAVHAVNPNAESVESLPALASIGDVPDPVDLAVIAVPAGAVVGVARECAAKGVRALVVLSAGFAESGTEGSERQRDLVDVCRGAGMRLVGPNCLGVLNTAPGVRLDATFAPGTPPPGRVGFLSQSGALGLAIIDHARGLGLGLSSFVSNGNKADISGNDLLQYWEQDDATDLIVLYLESFGNARKFSRLARRVGRRKPIVAVKSGRSAAGAKATSSHTGALISASDATVDALFRQAGVIRTDSLSALFDVTKLLEAARAPQGSRVGIVSNAGGLAIMCADACEAAGLELPELPAAVRDDLRKFLPETAATANPVDMIATASADDYRRTLQALGRSGAVDAIIAIFIPPLVTRAEDVAEAMAGAVRELGQGVPVVAVFASQESAPDALAGLPVYAYPEEAAAALGSAARYGDWLARDPGPVPEFDDVRHDEAAASIALALERGPHWLEPPEVATVLDCWGFTSPPARVVQTPSEAGDAVRELGGDVALKAVAPGLLHKTDAGAVALGIGSPDAAVAAAERMRESLAASGYEPLGYHVQRMAPPGVEMLVGVVHDEVFGPVVACGGGGTTAELIGDVALRLTPLTGRDAREMIESLRTYPLLRGYRGSQEVDVGALEQVVLRLAALVEAHAEVMEVDLNPVIVAADGALVVDARMRIAHAPPRRPWPAVGS